MLKLLFFTPKNFFCVNAKFKNPEIQDFKMIFVIQNPASYITGKIKISDERDPRYK